MLNHVLQVKVRVKMTTWHLTGVLDMALLNSNVPLSGKSAPGTTWSLFLVSLGLLIG